VNQSDFTDTARKCNLQPIGLQEMI